METTLERDGPSSMLENDPLTPDEVAAFLDGKLGFTAIPRVIKETMDAHDVHEITTLEMVRRVDKWARECARHTAQALELNA